LDLARELAQALLGEEAVDGAPALGAADDGGDGGIEAAGLARDELADGRAAFGDPGELIEQRRCLGEGLEVDGDGLATKADEALEAGREGRLGAGVAEELELFLGG